MGSRIHARELLRNAGNGRPKFVVEIAHWTDTPNARGGIRTNRRKRLEIGASLGDPGRPGRLFSQAEPSCHYVLNSFEENRCDRRGIIASAQLTKNVGKSVSTAYRHWLAMTKREYTSSQPRARSAGQTSSGLFLS